MALFESAAKRGKRLLRGLKKAQLNIQRNAKKLEMTVKREEAKVVTFAKAGDKMRMRQAALRVRKVMKLLMQVNRRDDMISDWVIHAEMIQDSKQLAGLLKGMSVVFKAPESNLEEELDKWSETLEGYSEDEDALAAHAEREDMNAELATDTDLPSVDEIMRTATAQAKAEVGGEAPATGGRVVDPDRTAELLKEAKKLTGESEQ